MPTTSEILRKIAPAFAKHSTEPVDQTNILCSTVIKADLGIDAAKADSVAFYIEEIYGPTGSNNFVSKAHDVGEVVNFLHRILD